MVEAYSVDKEVKMRVVEIIGCDKNVMVTMLLSIVNRGLLPVSSFFSEDGLLISELYKDYNSLLDDYWATVPSEGIESNSKEKSLRHNIEGSLRTMETCLNAKVGYLLDHGIFSSGSLNDIAITTEEQEKLKELKDALDGKVDSFKAINGVVISKEEVKEYFNTRVVFALFSSTEEKLLFKALKYLITFNLNLLEKGV